MSCWIVSPEHIDVLVSGLLLHRIITPQQVRAVRIRLVEENAQSYMTRYSHIPECVEEALAFRAEQVEQRWRPILVTPPAMLKAVQCYQYQSCEHDTWAISGAREMLAKLADKLAAHDETPAYNAAPWGIDSSNLTQVTL